MRDQMRMFCVVFISFLLFTGNEIIAAGDSCFSISTTKNSLTLSNSHLTMALGGDKGEFRITKIISKAHSGRNLISEDDPTIGLWKLHLLDAGGKESLLSTSAKPKIIGPVLTGDGKKIILRWASINDLNIGVTVELIVDDNRFIRARLNVTNNSEYRIKQVDFPQIGGLGPFGKPETDKLIWPRTAGRLIELPYKNGVPAGYFEEFPYPSASQSMQFTGIYGQMGGIYLAAHDSKCYIKRLQFSKRSSAKSINFLLKNYPENIGKPGNDYTMSYDTVISTFNGDWWDAGEIYRQWAIMQPWARKTTVLQDETVSPEFKEIVLWMGLWGSPELVESQNWKNIIEYFGVKMCGHWYSWSQAEFDTLYPEFLPAKKGFTETVTNLQKMGMVVMPYTNARLWDTTSESFKRKSAITGGVLNIDGQGAFEEYNNRKFLVMCPFSKFWEDTIISFSNAIYDESKVKAVYYDQLSAAGPIMCFNEKHGHKSGGGTYWADGYSRLLQRFKSEMKGRISFLTSESFTESYVRYIDGYLLWISFGPNDIPLAQMVYGGRTVFWGHTFVREDLVGNAFYVKLGSMLTRGIQPGWMHAWIMSPNAEKQREFLRQIVKLYDKTLRKEAFLNGRMRKPPVLSGLKGRVESRLAKQDDRVGIKVVCDPVLVGAWELPGGQYRILLVNVSDISQTVHIDLQKYLGANIKNATIELFSDNASRKLEVKNGTAEIELTPKLAAVLSINPEGK